MRNRVSVVAMLLLVGACSSGASSTAGSSTVAGDASTTVAGSAATTTTVSAASTAPTTTAPAPTTTAALAPLELRYNGLGPFDFGSGPTPVIDAIVARLGAPARNDVLYYDDHSRASEGIYTSLVGPYYYSLNFPVGQTVCWAGDFCAEFGGSSVADLHFIGWSYTGPPHMMASSSNLTIGAKWADFPSMIVYPTCYTTGGGTHHDIRLILEVSGPWDWLVSDGAGGFIPNLPNPELTRVTFMDAGAGPFQPEADC